MKDVIQKIEEATTEVAQLEGKQTLVSLMAKINEIVEVVNQLETSPRRDRGPKSEHVMSDDDARRVIGGDLKELSHKEAAAKLGLSYGQVYSARGGYTFKSIHKEFE